MTTLAIVVSLVGQAWAENANGERRALEVGDRLGVDETLIMEADARVDLDFGDNQQLTFLGEQQITAEGRGAMIDQVESLEPLERSEQPEAEKSNYTNHTDAPEGHGFVQLVRIGDIIEADGLTPVTVARIQEVLDEQGISLQQPQFVHEEHEEDRYEESDYAGGAKLAKLSISVDVVAGNDMVDATEAQQTHTLSGTVGGGVQPGDAVTVMVNGQAYDTTVNADGKTWQVDVPGSELAQDNKVHASVSGVEPNGTPVSADTERPYEVDDVTPTLSAELEGDLDGDGVFNASEIINGKVTGTVTLNADTVEVGDRLVIEDTTGTVLIDRPVTQADKDNGVSVEISVAPDDTTVSITATITDPAGNSSDDTAQKGVDNITPAFNVELEGDSNGDGVYNEKEIVNGEVPGTVTLDPDNTHPGDNLVVKDGNGNELLNRPVTQDDIDNGIAVDVPVSDGQTDVELSATVTDPAGNTDNAQDHKPVDNVPPGANVELKGAGSDGTYNESEIVDGKVPGEIALTPETEVGDTIVVTDGKGNELINRPVTQDDIDNGGKISVEVPVEPGQPDVEINVELTDPAGNTSDPISDSKDVDNVTPTVGVELEPGSGDSGEYNDSDTNDGKVEGTITFGPETEVGDKITVTDKDGDPILDANGDPITDYEVTQDDIDNGITVDVPLQPGDTDVELNVEATDPAGNTSTGSDHNDVDNTTPGATATLEPGNGPNGEFNDDDTSDGKVEGTVTFDPDTTEPGDTVKVTDKGGNVIIERPVTQGDIDNGIVVDVPISDGQTDVELNVDVTDPAGNTSSTDDSNTVDNVTPTVEVELEDGSGPNGNFNEDDTESGFVEGTITLDSSSTKPGDTVVVADGNGNELISREVTQDDIDNGIAVDVPVSDGQTDVELKATVTDPAGNSSDGKDDNAVDNVGPGATVELEDGTGPGGSYNESDITDGRVEGEIVLTPETEVGDTIVVTDGSGTELINRPVTQGDIDSGIVVDVPVSDGQTDVELNVDVTDPAGNTSSTGDSNTVDNVTPAVKVELEQGSGPNGAYNDGDASQGKVEGSITFDPANTQQGDKVSATDKDGNPVVDASGDPVTDYELTQNDIDNGLTVEVPITGSDTELELNADVTDAAGNSSSASDTNPVDAVTPTLSVELQGAGSDNTYSNAEINNGKVTATVDLDSGTVEEGDQLVIKDTAGTIIVDRPVSADDIANGVSVEVSVAPGDSTVSVDASITDPAGNASNGSDDKAVDATAPTVNVELEQGSGPNGEYNDDDTNDGKVTGDITFGPETEVGDKITVTDKDGDPIQDASGDPITDYEVTQDDIDNGITVDVPVQPGDTDAELNVEATDPAGNTSTGSDRNDVDNTTPGATATLEPGNGPNGEYNGDDTSDGKVEGTVTFDPDTTEPGDTVKVADEGGNVIIERPVTQGDIDNGIVVDVPVSDGQTDVELNVDVTDPAGNTSSTDDSNTVDNVTPTVKVELEQGSGPNGEYNDSDTNDGKVEGTLTLDPNNTKPGDTIVITDGNDDELISRGVTQDDIDNGIAVDVPVSDGQTDVELKATVTDPAGNSSDGKDDNAVDNVGPGATVELEDGTGPGGSYNEGDITDGTVEGEITLTPETEVGDTIVVTDGKGNELINRPVTQDDIDNGGKISVEVPVEPGQPDVEINVELTDPAGNESDPINDSKDVDNVTPTVEVELADGSSPDGSSYNKVDADSGTVEGTVNLDPTVVVGDHLVVTDGKDNTLFDGAVTQDDINNGVTVQVSITDTDTELELNAEITDEAGNSSTASTDKPVDAVTPTLTAELEGAGGDDVYNVDEITDGKVTGNVTLDADTVEEGDRLVIEDASRTVLIDRPVTQDDINDGVSVEVSVASGDTSVDIKATITDPSGNSSDDTDNKGVDNVTPAIDVTLEGTGADGVYNADEITNGEVTATITLDDTVAEGDVIEYTDSNDDPVTGLSAHTVTSGDITAGNISVQVPVSEGDTEVNINATITDDVGNSSSASDAKPVDNVAPQVDVTLDPGTGTGDEYTESDIVNGEVSGTVTFPADTEAGDRVVVTDKDDDTLLDKVVNQDDIDNGIVVGVPVAPGQTDDVEIKATVTDPAGNENSASDSNPVDNVTPTIDVALEGAGADGVYNADEITNGEVTAIITLDDTGAEGDVIEYTDSNGDPVTGLSAHTVTSGDITAGNISVQVPVAEGDTEVNINATITDAVGNSSSASDAKPVALGVELSIADDPVTEGDSITITATMDNTSDQDVTVTLNNGSQIIIPAGDKSADITVDSRPDDVFVQGDEAREYEIGSVTGSGYEHITTGESAEVTIQDDEDSVTVKLDATASVEEGGDITYTARLEGADGNSITANNDIKVTLDNGETITVSAGQANGDLTIDAPEDDVYENGETISNKITGVEEVDVNNNPVDDAPGSLENLEADNIQVDTTITDTTDPMELTISAPEKADEGSDIEITLTVDEPPKTDLVITLTDGTKVTIGKGETEETVTVTAPNNDENFGAGDATSGQLPGDWNIGIEKAEGGNYEYLDTSSNAVVKIDLDVPGLEIPEPVSQVDEAGLPEGSGSSADSEVTAGTFTITAGDVDELSTVDMGNENFSLQDLKDASTTPLTVEGTYGTLTITNYNESSGEVSYSYTLTSAADHSNGDVSDDFDITVTDTSGDSRTGLLEVGIVDDVPTAVDGNPQEVIEGGNNLTGNLIGNDTVGADGAFVNQISYTDSGGNLAEADIAEGSSVTVDTQYGELRVESNGDWKYTPVDSADHSAADPEAGKGLELADDFSYTLTDGDGDISSQATQQITVKDTVPEVGTAEDATVEEQYLPSGTDPDSDKVTQTGSLEVTPGEDSFDTVFDESNRGDLYAKGLTSGGEMLDYEFSKNGHKLTATADGNPVFTVTITNPAGADVGYEFTLEGPLDNVANIGDIELPLSFTVKDSDGDTAQGDFTVTVKDNPESVAKREISLDEDTSETLSTPANATKDTIIISDGPKYGEVTVDQNGTLTYTPNDDYSGDDSFSYTYTEGGEEHTVEVDVTVNPVADAPTIDVDDATITTDEDVATALGLNAPVITDDGTSPGNNPTSERLGEITLEGFPEGAKLLADDGSELHTFDSNGSVSITLTDGVHTAGATGDLSMSTMGFEGLKVLPPAEDHKNFTATVKATSYEVDGSDDVPLAGVNGAETSTDITVNVQAITDPVDLKINDGVNFVDAADASSAVNITMDEDVAFDLADLLQITLDETADGNNVADTDGSEERWFTVTGLPEGSDVNGHTITAAESTDGYRVDIPNNYNGDSPSLPKMEITAPEDFSGDIDGVKVTLHAQDRDSDGVGSGPTTGDELTEDVYVDLNVHPVAGDVIADDVSTDEDTAVAFMENIEVTDKNVGDSNEVITKVAFKLPTDWELITNQPTVGQPEVGDAEWTVTGDGSEADPYIIEFTDGTEAEREAALKEFEITPPAHSSKDEDITVKVTTTDTNTVDGNTETDTKETTLGIKVNVAPVAEEVGTDTDGDTVDDLTVMDDYTYETDGKEDEWFDLGTDGGKFQFSDGWSNQDASEETFAVLTPSLFEGDGTEVSAIGAKFQWDGGSATYTGDPIEVPMGALDSLEFMATKDFAGTFEIKVQAKTVDYDEDHPNDLSKADIAISGEATLKSGVIEPVADTATTSLTARVNGNEDEPMDLSIRPNSTDPNEIFDVTLDSIPDGATLTYGDYTITKDGAVDSNNDPVAGITVSSDGTGEWEIEFKDFDKNEDMTITPPLDSNDDFTLGVSTVTVDILEVPGDPNSPYRDTSDSESLDMVISPKGVADPAKFEIDTDNLEYTEDVAESTGISVSGLIKEAELKDDDGSETLTFKLGDLPAGFEVEGATFMGGEGADREWSFNQGNLNNVLIKAPANYNGIVDFNIYTITTENDGDSLTQEHDVQLTITPTPEAAMNLSVSIDEDVSTALDFSVVHQNGDDDESISKVWIKVESIKDGLTLTDENGTALSTTENIDGDDYYVVEQSDLDNIYAQGAANWHGTTDFDVKYEVTDPGNDGLTDVTEVFDGNYTVEVAPITDPVTLDITSGADTTLTEAGTVNVALNVGNDDGNNGHDYDGSEMLTRIIVEGVPEGVVLTNPGSHLVGDGTWVLEVDEEMVDEEMDGGALSPELDFDVHGSTINGDHAINITVVSEDAGNGQETIVSEAITITTDFAGQGGGENPAEIKQWEQTDFDPTEDTGFTLDEAINAEIDDSGVTSNSFTVTLKDLPESTTVDGMTRTVVNGEEIWSATGQGGDDDLQGLLEDITVTAPADFNSNKDQFEYNATLTTHVPSGGRAKEDTAIDQTVIPVTDEAEIVISAPAVDEGNNLEFNINISNPADDPAWTIVDGELYLQLDEPAELEGGKLMDGNTELTATAVNGVTGITDGDYYVVDLNGAMTKDLTYAPKAGNEYKNGDVTLKAWVQGQETGADNIVTTQVSQAGTINPVNNGYDLEVADVEGDENPTASEEEQAIRINVSGDGLVDDDGSEKIETITLKNVPNDFLVFAGSSESDASLQDMADNAGGTTTNTWILGNEMPEYIAILPPKHWSGTIEDLTLSVISGETSLKEKDVTEETFNFTVNPVADGVELNPTASFGNEGEIVGLNLNAKMKDLEKAGETDESTESVSIELKGLGEHASFYIGDVLSMDDVAYNDSTDTYTITGLSQSEVDDLGFIQANSAIDDVDGIEVRAQSVESGNDDTSDWTDWKGITGNITDQTSSSNDDNLLWTGNAIDGRDGDDTIQLRFGEDVSASDLSSNLSNIETIDLGIDEGNAIGDDEKGLSIQDVLDMTDSGNELTIDGDGEDSVFLSQEWGKGEEAANDSYVAYTNTTSGATINIAKEMSINDDVPIVD